MDSVDLEVLKASAGWVEQGHRGLLVTVVKTWGSSPRPEGAMLALRDDGLVVGSVSGGCIEDDLIERVRCHGIEQAYPSTLTYGMTAEEAHRFGLPCGGTMQLVLEPLSQASGIAQLCRVVESGQLVTRTLDLASGVARLALASSATPAEVIFDGTQLVTCHGPRYRMLVIGAGQLSRYLCQIALGLDYQVTVCDPRDDYTAAWAIPGVRMVRTMPDDAVLEMKLDPRCAVLALTHDPKLDDLALLEALKTPAFYVGALGSRRNNAARRERLKLFDLAEAELARLHGPVGIYIGSRTPAEIAVSILAEVTAAKNGVLLPERLAITEAKTARERVSAASHIRDSGYVAECGV
ncbi:XdhC family protein [Paraburkholderia bonniea]|uniref:XdhC family protein n=1 Tax=Paraburkholderia bonniea TaxID=2152891 RepID=UPI002572F9FB|nr:XdhC family protein [Paraburkholderia bonniea]WJF90180.1 XdhC family protein [Paraburkholderia bonniea]WJF93494.1 XdhC family protein [Paraburkholderia bonniea]